MAVATCTPPSASCIPHQVCPMNERFYKFGTPSPPSAPQQSPMSPEYQQCYSPLDDSGFHSDEEIQKVSLATPVEELFMLLTKRMNLVIRNVFIVTAKTFAQTVIEFRCYALSALIRCPCIPVALIPLGYAYIK